MDGGTAQGVHDKNFMRSLRAPLVNTGRFNFQLRRRSALCGQVKSDLGNLDHVDGFRSANRISLISSGAEPNKHT